MNLNEYSPKMSLKTNDWDEDSECYFDPQTNRLRAIGRMSRVGFNLQFSEGDKIKLATTLLQNVSPTQLLDFAPVELIRMAKTLADYYEGENLNEVYTPDSQ